MFKDTEAFSGYSINNAEEARHFYADLLGMGVTDVPGMEQYGMLELHVKNGHSVLLYSKDDHKPATFTVLSFPVEDIDSTVAELTSKGIEMLRYDDPNLPQDEKGIVRSTSEDPGPSIAWFTDPAGNNLAVLQEPKV